jgi:hypothetical protein
MATSRHLPRLYSAQEVFAGKMRAHVRFRAILVDYREALTHISILR